MFCATLILLLAISGGWCEGIVDNYEMNMTEYYMMPRLYDFDDYDRCLQEFTNQSTYCFVRVDVQPQNDSAVWHAIADVSQYYKHHFDHRQLYYGMCVHWCEGDLEQLQRDQIKHLYGGLINDAKMNITRGLFASEEWNRQRYNRLLNQCINLRLRQSHGLMAKTMVEYCDTNYDDQTAMVDDAWNLTFYGVLFVLVLLVTLSTLFDVYLKQNRNDKLVTARDHYKAQPRTLSHRLLLIYSAPRNWYRLNQEPTGQIGRDLRFLDCFKFFCMFFVVYAHTIWVMYEGAISNPQDPERGMHTIAGTFVVSGATVTVTFFVISGFLLTINWLAVTKVKPQPTRNEYIALFIIFNLVRYVRLTLPLAFMLLLTGVQFDTTASGPFWRHIVEREQLACRKNWWTNLLYVNNYVNENERCHLQSWYLAADTHSFVLSLIILMLANRWPKVRNYLIGVVIVISHIVPGIVVYVKKYYPLYIASPQRQREDFVEDDEFRDFYAPFYMNFGCYFCGVLAALVYDYLARTQFRLRDFKLFHVLWYALVPAAILWIMSAHPLLQNYYDEPPRLWGSIYASMQRNSWSFGLAIFIVGMASRVGWVFRRFACLPIFRFLGRLTYGTFIVHLYVVRVAVATQREPLYYSNGTVFTFVFYTMAISYVLSFMLAILVELPVTAALKLLRKTAS